MAARHGLTPGTPARQLAEERLSIAALAIARITRTAIGYGDVAGIVADAMARLDALAHASPHAPFNPDTALSGAILSEVASRVEAIRLAALRPENIHGPGTVTDAAQPGGRLHLAGASDHWLARALLDGTFGRDIDGGRSSARFEGLPRTTVPGNADMSGISMANYHTSPLTRAILATGMNYGTFDYMRGQGFNRTHIQHAGEDARRHGYNPNNREVVNDFGLVNQHDGARRTERNDLLDRYRAALRGDADLRRLREQRERTTGEERARIDAEIRERDRIIRQRLGIGEFIQRTPAEAREADQRIFNRTFTDEMGIGHQLVEQAGPQGVVQAVIAAPPPPAQPPVISDQDRARATADVAQTQLQMDAELAALRGPQQPAVVQPPAAGDRRVVVQLPPNTPQGPT